MSESVENPSIIYLVVFQTLNVLNNSVLYYDHYNEFDRACKLIELAFASEQSLSEIREYTSQEGLSRVRSLILE